MLGSRDIWVLDISYQLQMFKSCNGLPRSLNSCYWLQNYNKFKNVLLARPSKKNLLKNTLFNDSHNNNVTWKEWDIGKNPKCLNVRVKYQNNVKFHPGLIALIRSLVISSETSSHLSVVKPSTLSSLQYLIVLIWKNVCLITDFISLECTFVLKDSNFLRTPTRTQTLQAFEKLSVALEHKRSKILVKYFTYSKWITLCNVMITVGFSKEEVVELFGFIVVFSEQHLFTSRRHL